MPAGPATPMTHPCPLTDRSNMPVMVCSSQSRPTKVGCDRRPVRLVLLSTPSRRCAVTGSSLPLILHQLRFAQHGGMFDQSRGGLAEHHPARWGNRFHALSHPDLLTDRGVTQSTRTDFTGDHLTGVRADSQPQVHTVAVVDLDGKPVRPRS